VGSPLVGLRLEVTDCSIRRQPVARLIYDCMIGDSTLFQRADMVEAGWSVVDPLLRAWADQPPADFPNYAPGSWGPQEADDLLRRDGRHWRTTV